MSTARRLTILSVLAVLACALVYVVALGTAWGVDVDARALPRGTSGEAWARAHAALRRAVDTVHVATLALAAATAAFVALRRRRSDLAFVAIATVAGASATTQVLKPMLARGNPLGGESARWLDDAFPSGHATAAMSIALVAVIVAPRAWRPFIALAASVYAASVGVGLVVLLAHYPSDVVGGYLVAGAWATAMSAIALARSEHGAPARPVPLPTPGLLVALLLLAATLGGLLLVPASHLGRGIFAVSAVVIAGIALAMPVALTVVLGRERRPTIRG
ncbi:MAG TPA: phosphatase PAP2 family protein [Thermoleophilaceae bacterium]|nr:phosphatase PAP2 family protein [Thermoleophilaceae bacterium]